MILGTGFVILSSQILASKVGKVTFNVELKKFWNNLRILDVENLYVSKRY
jgi:hypothetical protein